MDWYPLWNSLRIAAVSSILVFFSGIAAAYYAARLPKLLKGCLDVALTLPMVLPPTVVGYFLLLLTGSRRPLGMALEQLGLRLVMDWKGGILAAFTVSFPLMYRTARGAFESFDETLGEYGATSMLIGYTPGRTATISTTVYQMWRTGNDRQAFLWVCVNLAISAAVLLAVNSLEQRERLKKGGTPIADCKN